ncbi:WD40/YVTN/BNR-like repeat-containing protein [Thalassolituus sp.]|uniref:WD40/YVTN/BNR-like repeat-containing protein n=1 Tax=Thalassolituus sp. TaxID=2030822 RepID=UPI002A7EEAF3|nr:YCF48-related protein [Thalassolituus sp.]
MFFNLVKPKGCANGDARLTGLSRVIALCTMVLAADMTQAEWKDPLESPALQTMRAHESLLLDVTRAGNRLVSVGSYGHIVFSDDNGMSWRQSDVPVSVTLTAVHFSGDRYGWAVGHDGVILHSSDAGRSWEKQFDGFTANDAIVRVAKANLAKAEDALVAASDSGNDLRIENAEMAEEAASFAVQDAEYDQNTGSTKPFLDVWFYDANRGFAVGAYGMFFQTLDGGKNWEDVSSRLPNPDRLHLNAITSVGPTSLAVVGEMGLIVRSDDLGQTWVTQDSPYDGSLFGIVDSGDLQLLFGLRGHVFRSIDDGITWVELTTGSEQTLLGGVVGNGEALLVGNAGSVVVLNEKLTSPRSIILGGRKASSSVVETNDGHFIIVGEAGVKILDASGELMDLNISMATGEE